MGYSILADFIVVVHFAYVSYVVFGQLLIIVGIPLGWRWIRNVWFRVSHLAMILFVALEAYVGMDCPLTTWEYDLRAAAGQDVDERSFVARLVHDLMFCPADSCNWMVLYVGFAALVVLTFVIAPPRWRKTASVPLR